MLKMRHSGSGQQRMILVMVNKNQISIEYLIMAVGKKQIQPLAELLLIILWKSQNFTGVR